MATKRSQVATLDRVPRQYESIQAAARRASVSEKTIRRRIDEGVLKAYRVGRLIRLDPLQVDRALDPASRWT